MTDQDKHFDLTVTSLLQSMKTAVLVIDVNYKIQFSNEAGLSLLETGYQQLNNRYFFELLLQESFDKKHLDRVFSHSEEFSEAELQLCFIDGRCITVDLHVNQLVGFENELVLIEIIPIDKQRKISQETQQYAQQMAARELIRGLAHEIKNPLGGIRGAAQLLSRQLASDEQKEFTEMIMEQADRLRGLVDRLLGPNSLPNKQLCNLHVVIEKVRSVIEAEQSHNIVIERDYDPSIPDVFIDSDMLQQALLNIVRNASQALKEARIQHPIIGLRTRVERRCVIKGKTHNLCALISVVDNGPGIPQDLRDTLFYPMVTSRQNGSGLGLSIAQTLTDHHQGKIDVESFPGYTEFTLYIPILKKDSIHE